MPQYDNSGTLFRNDRKENEKDRDYSGSITVDGIDYWLSAWIREGKTGTKFLSIKLKRKDAPAAKTESSKDALNDRIPF
jgi:hypothetical protein